MLDAIRDASVGEGRRIRRTMQTIQGEWLYSELARVAHFEWDGAGSGSAVHLGGKFDNPLNRFWLVDLEDFDESPVRVVKRPYAEGSIAVQVKRLLESSPGVEDQDADRRMYRFLHVETHRLVEAFGEIVMGVGSRPAARLHVYSSVGHIVDFSGRAEVPEARQAAGGATAASNLGDGPAVARLTPPDTASEVPMPDDVGGVLEYLKGLGLDDLADDLEYKRRLIEEDPDELPICDESARGFVSFIAAEKLAGSPALTVDVDGYLGLEWIIPDPLASRAEAARAIENDDRVWGRGDGVLGLWFMPSGMVRVYGTSGPVGQGIDRMRVNDTVPPGRVMNVVEPFLSRLEA